MAPQDRAKVVLAHRPFLPNQVALPMVGIWNCRVHLGSDERDGGDENL